MEGLPVYSHTHGQGVVVQMANLAYIIQLFDSGEMKLVMPSDLEVLH